MTAAGTNILTQRVRRGWDGLAVASIESERESVWDRTPCGDGGSFDPTCKRARSGGKGYLYNFILFFFVFSKKALVPAAIVAVHAWRRLALAAAAALILRDEKAKAVGGIVHAHTHTHPYRYIYYQSTSNGQSDGRTDVRPGCQLKALCTRLSASVRRHWLVCACVCDGVGVASTASTGRTFARTAEQLGTVPEVAAAATVHQQHQHRHWRGCGTDITEQRAPHGHEGTHTRAHTPISLRCGPGARCQSCVSRCAS